MTAGTGSCTVLAVQAGNSNYNTASNSGSVTATKAALVVHATSYSKVAGTANPTLTAFYTGLVNGDTAAALTGAPSVSTTATTSSPAGMWYPITVGIGSLSSSNYSFSSFVNGKLTVVAAPTINLSTSAVVSGTQAGGYSALVTVTNTGTSAASNVALTVATLGGVGTTTTLPASVGTIGPNSSASVTVVFPAGQAGLVDHTTVIETYSGIYTGGTFSGSSRVVLQ